MKGNRLDIDEQQLHGVTKNLTCGYAGLSRKERVALKTSSTRV